MNHDTTRVEAFSDAVFGFSATLLVVSLEIPTDFDELVANLYGFIPFSVTFAALVLIWSIHRGFFARFRFADNWIIAFNAALLFVVLFYVYPLKFMAHSLVEALDLVPASHDRARLANIDSLGTLFLLYSAGFGALFLFVALMYRHVARLAERLKLTPRQAHDARWIGRQYFIFVGVAATSIVLTLTGVGLTIGLPGWIYAALGPLCYTHGKWSEKSAPR